MVDERINHSLASLFWGRTKDLILFTRIGALVFAAVAIASMSFCQLGFWPIGEFSGYPVYLVLLLAPVVMSAFSFGSVTGTLLAVFGGVVAYAHATFMPLDFFEVYYFGTPLNTIVLFGVTGLLAGLLFDFALKRDPRGGKRIALIILVCVIVSFFASALLLVNLTIEFGGLEYFDVAQQIFGFSVVGSVIQALIDAVLIIILCLATDWLIAANQKRNGDHSLYLVFRNFLILVSAIVFMMASGIIFSKTTIEERDFAQADAETELAHLVDQLNMQPNLNMQLLVGDYDKKKVGVIVVSNKRGVILASNDEARFKVGSSLLSATGESDYIGQEDAAEVFLNEVSSGANAVSIVQDMSDDTTSNMNFALMGIKKFNDGYAVIHRPAEIIYANRFTTMATSTMLALLIVIATSFISTILVRRVIVDHIDETNRSLAKITEGNLRVRAPKQFTREFTSLANGINATVESLGDMIDEVAKRNEQDLATAKVIQESALPTEFPAFPHIDKFDIYASMKTAKEVGGDFYDLFLIDDTTKVAFIMADVSGKGIPAALFMMTAKTQLRNYLEAGLSVDEAVNAANHQLCIGNDAGMFVTCWVAELDYETGELAYVNAGHNPPMLMHDDEWNWITKISGMPLGLFDGIPYDLHTLQLAQGDMIYTYTDGVTEAMSSTNELFGEERLTTVLNDNKDMNTRSVCVAVRRALTDYTHDAEQSDDITMLALKYGVPPETKAIMVLPADTKQLIHVCNYIHGELDRRHAPKPIYNALDIAAEELFVNVCRYAYPDATPENPGEARIGFEYKGAPPTLTVTIADDGIPYNPLEKPDAVTPDNIADVPIGGLGILMAKRNVDEMTYERTDGSNIVEFSKSW